MESFTISRTVLTLIIIIWSLTLVRSIILIFSKQIFKELSINEKSAYYPILNLFSILEALDISSYLGILLFIPVINLFILILMSIKLGNKFNCNIVMKFGLIFLSIIFYPSLSNTGKIQKEKPKETFLVLDDVKSENINLMTEEELKKENDSPYDLDPAVDSIFKTYSDTFKAPETYKAKKIEDDVLDKLQDLSSDVNENDDKTSSELNINNDYTFTNLNEENNLNLEFVDLNKTEEKSPNIEFIDL